MNSGFKTSETPGIFWLYLIHIGGQSQQGLWRVNIYIYDIMLLLLATTIAVTPMLLEYSQLPFPSWGIFCYKIVQNASWRIYRN